MSNTPSQARDDWYQEAAKAQIQSERLTRAELLKKMTGRELKPHDRTVDVTIRRIRKHFESVGDTPEIIATIHGEGYRFCGELEQE